MDRHNKEQRTKNMEAVKSRGNKTTEVALARLLRVNKINGWKRHYIKVYGKPDFVFLKKRIAIFVDGCFWHGCKEYNSIPTTNKQFWVKKINSNIRRDKLVNKFLKKERWKVIRFWEHEIKKHPEKCLMMLIKYLK